jgi:hypothetical protein
MPDCLVTPSLSAQHGMRFARDTGLFPGYGLDEPAEQRDDMYVTDRRSMMPVPTRLALTYGLLKFVSLCFWLGLLNDLGAGLVLPKQGRCRRGAVANTHYIYHEVSQGAREVL